VSSVSALELLCIAIGLAMDAFAVSLAASASGRARGARASFRLSFHFGLFQGIMPLLGWLAGAELAAWISAWDHWVAFALLSLVGTRMIRAGRGASTTFATDPSRGLTLVMLAVATSIDAFAVGLSLAMLGLRIIMPCILIGVVTAALSLLAIRLGGVLGDRWGKRMEIVGGIILLLVGIRILLAHLLTPGPVS
jgi:putative Mn2+ efflux pump MntP